MNEKSQKGRTRDRNWDFFFPFWNYLRTMWESDEVPVLSGYTFDSGAQVSRAK